MTVRPLLLVVISLALLQGCSSYTFPGVYRIDVPQGNVVTEEMVEKLKPGMTQRQVRFVLGTPLIEDTFNENRWDYVYSVRKGDDVDKRKKLSIFFEDKKLTKYDWIPDPADKIRIEAEAEAETEKAES